MLLDEVVETIRKALQDPIFLAFAAVIVFGWLVIDYAVNHMEADPYEVLMGD